MGGKNPFQIQGKGIVLMILPQNKLLNLINPLMLLEASKRFLMIMFKPGFFSALQYHKIMNTGIVTELHLWACMQCRYHMYWYCYRVFISVKTFSLLFFFLSVSRMIVNLHFIYFPQYFQCHKFKTLHLLLIYNILYYSVLSEENVTVFWFIV